MISLKTKICQSIILKQVMLPSPFPIEGEIKIQHQFKHKKHFATLNFCKQNFSRMHQFKDLIFFFDRLLLSSINSFKRQKSQNFKLNLRKILFADVGGNERSFIIEIVSCKNNLSTLNSLSNLI